MKRQTRRILLELAIADLLALVRPTVERNRRGDGSPSPTFVDLATTLDRIDRLGGVDALFAELFLDEAAAVTEPDAAARSGARRPGSAPATTTESSDHRTAPERAGQDRPVAAAVEHASSCGAFRRPAAHTGRHSQTTGTARP